MSRKLANALTLAYVCVNKNFNLGHNCLTRWDGAFILHMCSAGDKIFHIVP